MIAVILSVLAFCIVTIPKMLNHAPWCDEVHSWHVAQYITFSNCLDVLRFEGNSIVWFLILMPFARLNFPYPQTLLIINWLFACASIVILWLKAPFNTLIKLAFTFSSIMLGYYAVVARCYSIGMLGLFVLAALFKNRSKYPILYPLLIGFVINTSAVAAIPALTIAVYYIFDLIKHKKQIISPILIISCAFLVYAIPFCSQRGITAALSNDSSTYFLKQFFVCHLRVCYIAAVLCIFSAKNSGFAKFFITASVTGALVLFNFIYSGHAHHYSFMFIYLILALWFIDYKVFNKYINIILTVCLSSMLLYPQNFSYCSDIGIKNIANKIKNDKLLHTSKIYTDISAPSRLSTYFYPHKYFYNYCDEDIVKPQIITYTTPKESQCKNKVMKPIENQNVYFVSNSPNMPYNIYYKQEGKTEDFYIYEIKKEE